MKPGDTVLCKALGETDAKFKQRVKATLGIVEVKPGATVAHQGKFWDVEKVEMRYYRLGSLARQVATPEKWVLLIIRDGRDVIDRQWVRFEDLEDDNE